MTKEQQTQYDLGYKQGFADGKKNILISYLISQPDYMVNKEVNEILAKPFEEVEKILTEITSKKKKANMKDILIAGQVLKMIDTYGYDRK